MLEGMNLFVIPNTVELGYQAHIVI